jgi:hypothetical protein
MKKSDLLRRSEELLMQPANSLFGKEELKTLNWDSLKALEFLSMVDEVFGGDALSAVALAEVRRLPTSSQSSAPTPTDHASFRGQPEERFADRPGPLLPRSFRSRRAPERYVQYSG